MRRHAIDITVIFVLSTLVTAYVALSQPGVRDIAIHVYVLVIGALLMLALVTSTKEALPLRARSDLERALAERRVAERRLPELERSEREVTLATASAYDLHYRLLPHLRAVAEARLERRGLRLSPEHVGRWWDLLRPDREPPEEHFGGGIAECDLRALVDDLERM
jgi:predicted signal transduction protein with EAL and GGDEF domain